MHIITFAAVVFLAMTIDFWGRILLDLFLIVLGFAALAGVIWLFIESPGWTLLGIFVVYGAAAFVVDRFWPHRFNEWFGS